MPDAGSVTVDTVWVLLTAVLVFSMNTGFACLESGLCRVKNTVNILTKNFIVIAIGSVAFWLTGFALMFGNGNDVIGMAGWALTGADNSPAVGAAYTGSFLSLNWTGIPLPAKFFFQLAFACTAASIVSGAVAERVKLIAFIAFGFFTIALIYPITGHWAWGGGWLARIGFFDAAGSTVVHSVGGWCALTGVVILGPRLGKYMANGRIKPVFGHSMSLATIGALILWIGWIGFNAGSPMRADAVAIATIALTTNMAGAAGCLSATALSWMKSGKPDLSFTLNGMLGGLVAITASASVVSVPASLAIGFIAGVLVVYGVAFFDRLKLDDPVGALSVHLLNGVWGTLAVGLFANRALIPQVAGILSVAAATVTLSAAVWLLLKYTIGIRVSPEEEVEGLDLGQHGVEAYPGFVPTQEN